MPDDQHNFRDEVRFIKTRQGLLGFMVKSKEMDDRHWKSHLYYSRATAEVLTPAVTLDMLRDIKRQGQQRILGTKIKSVNDLVGLNEIEIINKADSQEKLTLLLTDKGGCYGFTTNNLFLRDIMYPWVDRAWLADKNKQ